MSIMGIYGRGLSVAEGNRLLTNMMNIKERFDPAIDTMTKNDNEAHRYYCGGDALYIFGKENLDSLATRTNGNQGDYIFAVFPASRDDEPGRPTLMVFIYQKKVDGLYHLMPSTTKASDDGLEHPGGNGAFRLKKSTKTGQYEIPETIPPNQITFALD